MTEREQLRARIERLDTLMHKVEHEVAEIQGKLDALLSLVTTFTKANAPVETRGPDALPLPKARTVKR